ncbi:M23 family metallopeptidase [Altererythrobacter arenosus]|uniref:M23 family metallopeptidase n=1 Tax=Altererythrobacter arenosus TaxID=3032592 RepID=A0ABY8FU18_9SPHN|nr:M23 family metallopeptidase [Altererythrobacter sp. CAU 1644]WFL78508.1 M23 family metallopeptidase [Altererythrobacter sp. CAU 1644]
MRKGLQVVAIVAAGFASIAATPAIANSSAAAVDVTEPVREAQAGNGVAGDVRFQQLFAKWEALDRNGPNGPANTSTVSIPSRMPLEGSKLTSDYGMRTHPVLGGRRNHKGVDLAAPTGTPVYATADGIVGRADWFSSYGLYVQIEHGADLETRYAHMSRLAVSAGERVKKGDIIGYVGSTGRSTGPHLHYEVRIDGAAVNPIPYMVESEAQQAFALATGQGGQGGD